MNKLLIMIIALLGIPCFIQSSGHSPKPQSNITVRLINNTQYTILGMVSFELNPTLNADGTVSTFCDPQKQHITYRDHPKLAPGSTYTLSLRMTRKAALRVLALSTCKEFSESYFRKQLIHGSKEDSVEHTFTITEQ